MELCGEQEDPAIDVSIMLRAEALAKEIDLVSLEHRCAGAGSPHREYMRHSLNGLGQGKR